ncbi:MAG: T9SS type A sorting domain-containing protein [Bacteroidia bacterium]|nr:T9SS type A sorting domain-containing protein [Bacteroidia bacterium]
MKIIYLITTYILVTTVVAQAQTYKHYFGNIHAHTSYSDGNKDSATSLITTPLQAYTYAKASQHIDFYGISEHNHYYAGMINKNNYYKGIADAALATVNDTFVAMYGIEWGLISGGGHVLIYGYDSLIGWETGLYDVFVAQNDYTNLWKKINKKTGAFAYLAHPTSTDYGNMETAIFNPEADSAIIGTAGRSGPAFSTNTTYTNPSTGNYITRYSNFLKNGYHFGIGLDHDTHNSVFGRSSAGRLVVLAPQLTQPNILEAFKQRRFYCSDDWNTKVDFAINNQIMGSIITQAGNPTLTVNVTDADVGDNITNIQVFGGAPGSGAFATTLTTKNIASFTYTHTLANNSTFYYYLKITQNDGNIIWTSPIWYTRNDATTTIPPITNFTTNTTTKCVAQPINFTDNSINTPTAWSWTATGATPNFSNLQNPTFSYANAGTYSISLTTSNASGSSTPVTDSVIVTNCTTNLKQKNINNVQLFPNPTNGSVTINLNELKGTNTLTLYNEMGSEIAHWSTTQPTHTINLSNYTNGVYAVKITTENNTIIVKKIVLHQP